MKNEGFTLRKRLRSFKFAGNGIRLLITREHNAWIHCFAAVCVTLAGWLIGLSSTEWIAIVFAIGSVLAAEAVNSSIEALADLIMIFLAALCLSVSLQAQQLEISQPRKAVRTSGDVGAVLLPVAGLTAILIEKDWQGLKQGALAGITTLGVTYLKKNVPTTATIIHFRPCIPLYRLQLPLSFSDVTDGNGDFLPMWSPLM